MLSRRDKLLILPWQQRKYENHLRKIKSALPVIDNRPPESREHVGIKSKKKQVENERCSQIERDNLILLQKLNSITRTNRVDNYWSTPQPNFLNRVRIYHMGARLHDQKSMQRQEDVVECRRIRQTKCVACTPHETYEQSIPEERVPWEPERASIRKVRSKSVPVRQLPYIEEVTSESPTSSEKIRSKSSRTRQKHLHKEVKSPQNITLSRGSLVLEVNFPPDAYIKFRNGKNEKLISRGLCHCKNLSKNI